MGYYYMTSQSGQQSLFKTLVGKSIVARVLQ